MPLFVWYAIAFAIGLIGARVAFDDKTLVEQVTDPVIEIFGLTFEQIGYGIILGLIIIAVGYAFKIAKRSTKE